jgi:hypothetical protein
MSHLREAGKHTQSTKKHIENSPNLSGATRSLSTAPEREKFASAYLLPDRLFDFAVPPRHTLAKPHLKPLLYREFPLCTAKRKNSHRSFQARLSDVSTFFPLSPLRPLRHFPCSPKSPAISHISPDFALSTFREKYPFTGGPSFGCQVALALLQWPRCFARKQRRLFSVCITMRTPNASICPRGVFVSQHRRGRGDETFGH